MKSKVYRYDWIVTPFVERISNILPLPYPIAWLLISEILFLFHFLVLFFFADKKYITFPYIAIDAIIPILLTLMPTAIISFSKRLEDFTDALKTFIDWPEEKIVEWHAKLISNAFRTKQMVRYGIILGIIVLIMCRGIKSLQTNSLPADISYLIFIFLLAFLGGATLYSMLGIAKIVNALGDIKELKVSIYQHPTASIKAAGKLLFGISSYAAFIYIIGLIYVFLKGIMGGFTVTVFFVGFGLFVIGYFIFPQIKIHDLMSRYKHRRIRSFSKHLDLALEKVINEPTSANLAHVRELFQIQKELNGMSEWSFDTKFILTLISVIIIPILIGLAQIYIQCFLKR